MDRVSVEQMTDFFTYVKEVHSIIADARTEKTGRICMVSFANDLTGVRKPPDSRFTKALSASSKQYEKLYPGLMGPTMMTNLPFVIQAFVSFITPLFPKTVRDRLLFKSAPFLASLRELTPLTTDDKARRKFLDEVEKL